MKLDSDDFELFALPRRFMLSADVIDERWKALQAEVHPDRFAAQGTASQRVAMQWAVRVNEAYRRLKDPLQRAAYLCELAGAPVDAERNTAMPPAFLMQQMGWRESLDEADGETAVRALADEVAADHAARLARVGALLDEAQDPSAAAAEVRALMFITRFREDLDDRLESFQS